VLRRGLLYAAAAAFAALGTATWWAWHQHAHNTFIRNWAPNIGTDFFAAAVTLTVVQAILARHEQERARPLSTSAVTRLRSMLAEITAGIGTDYSETHRANRKPLPANALEVLDIWLAEAETADTRRDPADSVPVAVDTALDSISDFDDIRTHDRDHLPADLVVSLGGFIEQLRETKEVREALLYPNKGLGDDADPHGQMQVALEVLTNAIRGFVADYDRTLGSIMLNEEQLQLANRDLP
jgi:hypothetical protein